MTPRRIFLDTNVFVLGAADAASPEGRMLHWAGIEGSDTEVVVVMSDDVLDQIRRVGRRLRGKDWAGELMANWNHARLSQPLSPILP